MFVQDRHHLFNPRPDAIPGRLGLTEVVGEPAFRTVIWHETIVTDL